MHPALSVNFFTTFSGAGYGLLFLLGLFPLVGSVPEDGTFIVVSVGVALSFVTVGLLSSTVHLHHPERAWRSFSQWRSSWLSREGIAAVVTYIPALLLAWMWMVSESAEGGVVGVGIIASLCAAIMVGTTAMIYASLKPIRQWHNPFVVPLYFGFALMQGTLWLAVLLSWFDKPVETWIVVYFIAVVAVWTLKLTYWWHIDHRVRLSTTQSATGLSGNIKMLDPPHTEENYLLREMGYRVARKHANKLRRLAFVAGAVFPFFLAILAFGFFNANPFALLFIAAIAATAGTLLERWLFFAEATHTVTLYYGDKK